MSGTKFSRAPRQKLHVSPQHGGKSNTVLYCIVEPTCGERLGAERDTPQCWCGVSRAVLVHGATCSICSVGYRQFANYLKSDSCWSGLTRTDERRANEVRCLGLRALEHRCHDELCGAPLGTQTTVEKVRLQATPQIFSLSLDRRCMSCMLQLVVLCESARRSASERQTMSPSVPRGCNSKSGMVCSGGGWLDALCRRDAGRGLCSARKAEQETFSSARVAAKRGGKDGAPIRNYSLNKKYAAGSG